MLEIFIEISRYLKLKSTRFKLANYIHIGMHNASIRIKVKLSRFFTTNQGFKTPLPTFTFIFPHGKFPFLAFPKSRFARGLVVKKSRDDVHPRQISIASRQGRPGSPFSRGIIEISRGV